MRFGSQDLRNLLKSGGTQRFHTHAADLIKTQDVSQHSYNVFWLVYALTYGDCSKQLLVHALAHDAGERWTGDVPAPTKRNLDISTTFGEFEEKQLRAMTGLELPALVDNEPIILKVADSLEGARFCFNEFELGNRRVLHILGNFIDYAQEAVDRMGSDLDGFDIDLFYHLVHTFSEPLNESQ
jgi:5'-deoxynucleotidase YfbR-like HD superfamily hydrolase